MLFKFHEFFLLLLLLSLLLQICQFQNPTWLEHELTRLDYLFASITSQTDLNHFTKHIDAEINTHSDRLRLNAMVNGRNVSVPNLPLWFNRHIDAKYDRPEQIAFSIGYARKYTHYLVNQRDSISFKIELFNFTLFCVHRMQNNN